jgi:hypothetical protein
VQPNRVARLFPVICDCSVNNSQLCCGATDDNERRIPPAAIETLPRKMCALNCARLFFIVHAFFAPVQRPLFRSMQTSCIEIYECARAFLSAVKFDEDVSVARHEKRRVH